jgi:DNA primase large subunit
MDTKRAARYPFLRESSEFAEKNSADLESLLTSESYAPARNRGRERVLQALQAYEVSYVELMTDYDRLIEVMSYPYARMLVSQVGDRFLTKRYALSEAVRMNALLNKEDRETVLMVSEELGVESTVARDGTIHMKFPDYLRLSSRMNSVDWKLINSDIHHGIVYLPQDKYSRLMQNALQDKIESELPLMTPDEYKKYLQNDVTAIQMALADAKMKMSPTNGEGMKSDYLPPCLIHILEMSRNGLNLPHSARFAVVTFLRALGMGYDDIIKVFAESPDFDESKSEYQIKHIMGEISGGEGYSPPECKTMKTNGLCFNPDSLCEQEWMTHPLKYYRAKSRDRSKQQNPGPQAPKQDKADS